MDMVLGMLFDIYDELCEHKPIIHTDQGLHYQNAQWQLLMKRTGCIQSMSRKGNCLDNAVAESFFSKVKTEFSDGSDFIHPKLFIQRLNEWIHWYNERRIKESLSGMSPKEYRVMKTHQP
jgi:transposase InsO family protein